MRSALGVVQRNHGAEGTESRSRVAITVEGDDCCIVFDSVDGCNAFIGCRKRHGRMVGGVGNGCNRLKTTEVLDRLSSKICAVFNRTVDGNVPHEI